MNSDEIRAALIKFHELDEQSRLNDFEAVNFLRELLLSEGVYDNPFLNPFKESWELLETLYERKRDYQFSDTPFDDFFNHIVEGSYPPPEIMQIVQEAFIRYLEGKGNISLDEAFFGVKHTKYKSHAYEQEYRFSYSGFHTYNVLESRKPESPLHNKSMEKLAESFLYEKRINGMSRSELYGDTRDVESFLRGYRRWKAKYKSSPDKS